MKTKELIETCKWAFNRSLAILHFEKDRYDKMIDLEVNDNLKPTLVIVRNSYSIKSLENSSFGRDASAWLAEIPECGLDEKKNYLPRNYSSLHPFYTSCSFKLNKEFRRLHDEISEYLYN